MVPGTRTVVEPPMQRTRPPSGAEAGEAGRPAGKSPQRRVYALNLIRVTLFTLVLFVHSVGSINWDPEHYRGMQLFTMLVHCARYGFVFVTGFVLFLAYYRSRIGARTFWRRRFGFVVLPYVAWTVIYTLTGYVFFEGTVPGTGTVTGDIATALVQGNAKYQLYFLLISMQIYLFFPALRALLRRTEGRHGRVLAAATGVQVGVFVLLSLWHPGYGWYAHMWKVLPTYALFLVGGALAAVHYDRFAPWVRRRRPWLLLLVVAGTAFSIPMFFATSSHAYVPEMAFAAYSIENLPWYLAAVALLYIAAQAWEDRRGDGRGWFARLVDHGAVRAFGIFAVHPLVLDLIRQTGFVAWLYAAFPDATVPRSVLLGTVTLIGTLSAVELILHTPLSRVLVARNMLRPLGRRGPSDVRSVSDSSPAGTGCEHKTGPQIGSDQSPNNCLCARSRIASMASRTVSSCERTARRRATMDSLPKSSQS